MPADVRIALRSFSKVPGFTAVAVFSLALGIGVNTAIFSVVNSVLLRPLAYQDAGRLTVVWETNPRLRFSLRDLPAAAWVFQEWRGQSRSFQSMAAVSDIPFNLTDPGEPERVAGARVSASMFALLGVRPMLGRTFSEQEDQYGRHDVVVLGHSLWQRRFGGDPRAVGRKVVLDGMSHTVVGVMPPGFAFPHGTEFPAEFHLPAATEIWRPLAISPEEMRLRGNHNYVVLGRLRPDVPLKQAYAEMNTIERRLVEAAPDELNRGWRVALTPFHEQVVRGSRPVLLVLLCAVGAVLLICCVNVANLLLARADRRRREVALRMALGAGRLRLTRLFLTESVLLALAGGAAGLLLAYWAMRALPALGADLLPRWEEVSLDARVLAFTLGVSMVSGLLFGLAPAVGCARLSLAETLKQSGSRTATASGARGRNALVVAEMALSLVLLVAAGLMVRSLARLLGQPTGLRTANVLTMQVSLPSDRYPRGPRRSAFFEQVLARITPLPGVEAAAVISELPLTGDADNSSSSIEGRPPLKPEDAPVVQYRSASPDYFRAAGVPLHRGRGFTSADGAGAPLVAVVSETLARRFWPDEDPIGKSFKRGSQRDTPWFTVIGVSGDVRHDGLDREPLPQAYVPYWQHNPGWMSLVVRTSGDPLGMAKAVRSQIWAVDRTQPVTRVKAMEQLVADSVAQPRLRAVLLGVFAALALLLAAVGTYGVISYSVSQRTQEIGVRMALGARRGDALRLVLYQGMRLALAGAALGILIALAAARALSSLLFGVTAADPLTVTGATLLLLGAALIAAWVPARRATRVDPLTALRCE